MLKVKRGGGFTLAELLIVMAIIVVLAAIAIPTFGKQLETARESNDAELIRAAATDAFSEAYTGYVTTGTVPTVAAINLTFKQTSAGFEYVTPSIKVGDGEVTLDSTHTDKANIVAGAHDVTFAFVADGLNGIKLDSITIAATPSGTNP